MKILTNKPIKLFLTVLATAFVLFGNAATITSTINGGAWSATTSWEGGTVPGANDDVIIIANRLTLDVDVSVLSITIKNGTWPGNLEIGSHNITTTGDFKIIEDGLISATAGAVVTVGDGAEDGFIMEGSQMAVTGGTLNVSGYFHLNSGKFAASNDIDINVATAGSRNDTIRNIYIDPSAELAFNNVTLTLTLENGNLGSGEEVYVDEAILSSYTGSLILNVLNESNTTDDYSVFTDIPANDLVIDIKSGNLCELQNTPGFTGVELLLQDIEVKTGAFKLVSGTYAKLSEDFTGTTNDAITIDGILYATLNLTLNSNLSGGGTVYTGNYSVGSNTVFDVTIVEQDDGRYLSASTWFGSANDSDWFNAANWQTNAVPVSNTDVTIWSGAQTFPIIDKSGAQAKNLIVDALTSLTISSIGDFTSTTGLQVINNSGTLTIDGGTFDFSGGVQAINNAASTMLIDNGGQMTITFDQSSTARKMDNLGAINLNNNSSLTITGSLNMAGNSTLDVQGGSSVEIKQ